MGWRSKFIFLLIVYCAGFATAVYCLAPTPEQKAGPPRQFAGIAGVINSEKLVTSVRSGIDKCMDLSKEAAGELAKRIQEEIEQAQSESDK